jgi:osmotically-inducible protein OsmY
MQTPLSQADEHLRQTILAALATDENTQGAIVRVGVLNGFVHLAGRVDSLAVRAAVESIAQQVAPGYRVVNRIEAPDAPSSGREIRLEETTDIPSSPSQ